MDIVLPVSTQPQVQPAVQPTIDLGAQPMELWGFLENSDFQRRKGRGSIWRQDEVEQIRHDEFLHTDYQLMVDIGCVGVRDAARWYITHKAPGVFDWTWLDRVVAAADQ